VAGFWRKWFPRSSASPPSPSPTPPDVAEALADLAKLTRSRPALEAPAAFLSEILPRLYEDPLRTSIPAMAADKAQAKLAAGQPLLRGEAFHIDKEGLARHWHSLGEAVERHQGGDATRRMRAGLDEGRLDPGELLSNILAGRADAISARANELGLDPGQIATVLRLLLIPVLGPVNTAWAQWHQSACWREGFCPTCGSWPLLGELRGSEQHRYLRCGLCTAEWELAASVCPFCGLDDPRFVGRLDGDGEGFPYQAATCTACHGYLKLVPTVQPLSGPQLLIADLATMHLDVAAAERGYAAPE
jgi:FdhE protein